MKHTPTGRPSPGEYAQYAEPDIDLVEGEDAIDALVRQGREVTALLSPLADSGVAGLNYAPGKWTLKQVVGHLIDDERIFLYRALCVARGDTRPLPGFDEREYMAHSQFEARALADLIEEYTVQRRATVAFFKGLPDEAWMRRGNVNGYEASVRGLAFHIAGHELRHLRLIRERYLTQLG
jgi:hypothetical protein